MPGGSRLRRRQRIPVPSFRCERGVREIGDVVLWSEGFYLISSAAALLVPQPLAQCGSTLGQEELCLGG